jgi:hypothetical protein
MLIFSEYGSALGSAVPFFVAGVNDELFLEDLDLVDQSMRIPGDMMLVDVLLMKEQSEKFIKEERKCGEYKYKSVFLRRDRRRLLWFVY